MRNIEIDRGFIVMVVVCMFIVLAGWGVAIYFFFQPTGITESVAPAFQHMKPVVDGETTVAFSPLTTEAKKLPVDIEAKTSYAPTTDLAISESAAKLHFSIRGVFENQDHTVVDRSILILNVHYSTDCGAIRTHMESVFGQSDGRFEFVTTLPADRVHEAWITGHVLGNPVSKHPSPSISFDEIQDGTEVNTRLTIMPGGAIDGRMRAGGLPIRNQKFLLRRVKERVRNGIVTEVAIGAGYMLETDQEGKFSAENLHPGVWRIVAFPNNEFLMDDYSHMDYRPVSPERTFQVDGGSTTQVQDIEVVRRTGLRVRVAPDLHGQDEQGFLIKLTRWNGSTYEQYCRQDAEGAIWLWEVEGVESITISYPGFPRFAPSDPISVTPVEGRLIQLDPVILTPMDAPILCE